MWKTRSGWPDLFTRRRISELFRRKMGLKGLFRNSRRAESYAIKRINGGKAESRAKEKGYGVSGGADEASLRKAW